MTGVDVTESEADSHLCPSHVDETTTSTSTDPAAPGLQLTSRVAAQPFGVRVHVTSGGHCTMDQVQLVTTKLEQLATGAIALSRAVSASILRPVAWTAG